MKEYLGKNGLMALVDNVKAWANGAFSARAFAKVKVGSAVVQASNKEDALNLVAGENVTISAQGSSVTISAEGGGSEYGTATTQKDGLMSKGDKANLDEVKGWYDTAVGGSEVGSAIDKWHDVTEFLAGISDDDTLKGILDTITREVETLKSDVMTGSVVAGKAEALAVSSAVGGSSKPVYLNGNGFAEVCGYDLKDISEAAGGAASAANSAAAVASNAAEVANSALTMANAAQPAISDLDTIRTRASNGNSAFTDLNNGMYAKNADLAKVAKSGSYKDLTNKPSIPAAVNESTVSGWGFTKNTGTYSKPSGGIPKTDLASGVQESLNRADSAYVMTEKGIMRNELNSAITEELDSKLEAKDLGNGTITLNGSDGSTIGSFKTNQASNTAITIPVTSVSNSGATLSWGEAIILAKVNGTPITAKLPSNPAKTYKAGEGLYESTANTFAVNAATTSAMGGMKVGYAANGKKYPVSIDSEGKAFVEVPWSADGGNAASADYLLPSENTIPISLTDPEARVKYWFDWGNSTGESFSSYTYGLKFVSADTRYAHIFGFNTGMGRPYVRQCANKEWGEWNSFAFCEDTIPDSTSGSKGVSVKLSGTVGEPKLLTTVTSSGVTSTSETVVLGKEVAAALGEYLPLSGGDVHGMIGIYGNTDTPLWLKSAYKDAEGACRIQFTDAEGKLQGYVMSGWGYIILSHRTGKQISVGDGGLHYSDTYGASKMPILHSGNVGNYAALSKGVVGANHVQHNIMGYTYATEDHGGATAGGIINAGVDGFYGQLNCAVTGNKIAYRYYNRDIGGYSQWTTVAMNEAGISAQSNNGGVKVQLGGTIGAPTLTVTTTTGGVSSSNQGIVSGSEVFGFVKDSKLELKKADGGTIGTFTTNQAQGTAITFNNASTSSAGLMSASDKIKLNSAVAGSGVTSIQVVSALPNNPDSNTLYIIK